VLDWLDVTRGVEIHHDGDLPARSGVGSSSAFTVGLLSAVHALEGRHTSKDTLAHEAIHVEQCLLREAVGLQDQVAAAFGGFNHVTIRQDGVFQVNPVVLPRARIEALQDHLLLLYTGIPRASGDGAQALIDSLGQRTAELLTLQQMVDRAIEILASDTTDLVEFGRLLHEAWRLKRELSPCVTTPGIDDLYETARRAGAAGGKLLGAGGGGFMLLVVRPDERARVAAALPGLIKVPFRFDAAGSRVVLYQPDGW
jgi:D-glycero-alpha-D-manno-heptose-7-phosphate kinase